MKSYKQISKHVSYREATKSNTAIKHNINNDPDNETLSNMQYVAENIFEPVRGRFCVPIAVTSFYRSAKLNKEVGGSSTSQHVKGEAMDLDADVFGIITNRDIFNYIKDNLEFDQLIWEYGDDKEPDWVHVSLKQCGYNRKEILVAYRERQWTGKYKTRYKYYED
jgi:zinc D-Ala-D-Ala carboxypeptidase